jgi:hypothetical protein
VQLCVQLQALPLGSGSCSCCGACCTASITHSVVGRELLELATHTTMRAGSALSCRGGGIGSCWTTGGGKGGGGDPGCGMCIRSLCVTGLLQHQQVCWRLRCPVGGCVLSATARWCEEVGSRAGCLWRGVSLTHTHTTRLQCCACRSCHGLPLSHVSTPAAQQTTCHGHEYMALSVWHVRHAHWVQLVAPALL